MLEALRVFFYEPDGLLNGIGNNDLVCKTTFNVLCSRSSALFQYTLFGEFSLI